jgi:hypothetical protein
MAEYLRGRFSTYTMWNNVERLREKETEVRDKLFQNLKNSLVSKGYADSNCFIRCSAAGFTGIWDSVIIGTGKDNTLFQVVCHDPTRHKFERLYGFNDGPTVQHPWSLSEEQMSKLA